MSKKTPVKSFGYSQQTIDIKSGRTLTLQGEVTRDEFGGYCSRLRIDGNKTKAGCETVPQEEEMQDEDGGANIDINLCKLLNIDVDKIALKIALGEDPWASPEDKENIASPTRRTAHTSYKKSKTSGGKSRGSC